jgi:hypothetical protein
VRDHLSGKLLPGGGRFQTISVRENLPEEAPRGQPAWDDSVRVGTRQGYGRVNTSSSQTRDAVKKYQLPQLYDDNYSGVYHVVSQTKSQRQAETAEGRKRTRLTERRRTVRTRGNDGGRRRFLSNFNQFASENTMSPDKPGNESDEFGMGTSIQRPQYSRAQSYSRGSYRQKTPLLQGMTLLPAHVLKRVVRDDPVLRAEFASMATDQELQLPDEALANVMANPFIHSQHASQNSQEHIPPTNRTGGFAPSTGEKGMAEHMAFMPRPPQDMFGPVEQRQL